MTNLFRHGPPGSHAVLAVAVDTWPPRSLEDVDELVGGSIAQRQRAVRPARSAVCTAWREGAVVLLVTQTSSGPVHDLADGILLVDASTTVQFGNTLFEHVSLLLLDTVALALMAQMDEPVTMMQRNHTNLQ